MLARSLNLKLVPLAPGEFIAMKNRMISFSDACFLPHDEAAAESGQDCSRELHPEFFSWSGACGSMPCVSRSVRARRRGCVYQRNAT